MPGLSRLLSRRPQPTASGDLHLALESLMATVNEHDTYTGGHSLRVADTAAGIGRVMGLEDETLELLVRAGRMHDVGKIGIPDQILRKSGPLTEQELHLVRLHPILGASILARVPGCDELVPLVLYHHERWDGRGYPKGLAEGDIPLGSRVIFVADAYDAMTTERPYGEVLTPDQALAELTGSAGKQFDPAVVEATLKAIEGGLALESTITL
ncbi:MAG: HD domain-containing protein [Actinobacteria bacterium]|nr:HD domain-containing protein [Actinomycetota bacterium]